MADVDPRRRGVNSEVTEGMPKETEEEVKGSRPTHVDRILDTILDGREFEAGQCRRIKGADPDTPVSISSSISTVRLPEPNTR